MAVKARALKPGGTIGVPAPAWPYYNRSEIFRGVEWWEKLGYNVKLADGIFARSGVTAGDPKQRANDVTAMFEDPDVAVVQCFDAGYGSAQIIPYLDLDIIGSNPKAFVGYSDITALHQAIRHHTDMVTFYGPLLSTLNTKDTKRLTQERLIKALTSTQPLGEIPRNPDDDYVRVFNGGTVRAELVGGCLWLLGQTIGTPWQIDLEGKIFFFEDVSSPPWYVDGLLNQMKQVGMLDGVAGFVIGEMEACDWRNTPHDWPGRISIEDVFEEYIQPLGVPTVYGFPMGHGTYLVTTPLGVEVTLDADAKEVRIEEAALVD
jgi:muramoyltetrapeptide carboxypeptidase